MGFWLGKVHKGKRCEHKDWKYILWCYMGRVKSIVRDEKAILKESLKGPKKVILSYCTKAFYLKYTKHSRLASCTPRLTGIPRNWSLVTSCRKASGDHKQVVTSIVDSIFLSVKWGSQTCWSWNDSLIISHKMTVDPKNLYFCHFYSDYSLCCHALMPGN